MSPTQDEREKALESFFAKLAEAAESGDKSAYTGRFASEAAIFIPHRPPIVGRDQIGDWFDDFRQTVVLVLDDYVQEKINIVGDTAMVRSRATGHYLVKSTGEQLPFDQKYLDVLQYAHGGWELAYHVASSNNFQPGLWEREWESA